MIALALIGFRAEISIDRARDEARSHGSFRLEIAELRASFERMRAGFFYFQATRRNDRADEVAREIEALEATIQTLNQNPNSALIEAQCQPLYAALQTVKVNFQKLVATNESTVGTDGASLLQRMKAEGDLLEQAHKNVVSVVSEADVQLLSAILAMRKFEAQYSATFDPDLEGYHLIQSNKIGRLLDQLVVKEPKYFEPSSAFLKYMLLYDDWVNETKRLNADFSKLDGMIISAEPLLADAEKAIQQADARVADTEASARHTAMYWATVALLITIIGSAAISTFVARDLVRALGALRRAMGHLAHGDTAVHIPYMTFGNEIGDMARALAVFRGTAVERETLHSSALDEANQSAERGRRIEAAVSGFEQSIDQMLSELRVAVLQLDARSKALRSASTGVRTQAGSAEKAAESSSGQIASVASTIAELANSIRIVASKSQRTAEASSRAVSQGEETKSRMEVLAEGAARIGQVVDFIQNVARQTNLLALNASIEAARAGTAGRGFAVIAAEVRNLSEQTAQATQEIAERIESIQTNSVLTVDAVRTVNEVIGEMRANVASVTAAVTQQDVAVSDISQSMSLVAGEAQSGAEAIRQAASEAEAADHIGQDVDALARSLSSAAERLNANVSVFVQQVRRG